MLTQHFVFVSHDIAISYLTFSEVIEMEHWAYMGEEHCCSLVGISRASLSLTYALRISQNYSWLWKHNSTRLRNRPTGAERTEKTGHPTRLDPWVTPTDSNKFVIPKGIDTTPGISSPFLSRNSCKHYF